MFREIKRSNAYLLMYHLEGEGEGEVEGQAHTFCSNYKKFI